MQVIFDDLFYLASPELFRGGGCWFWELSKLTDVNVTDRLKKVWYKS
jgi:hypothetical protein